MKKIFIALFLIVAIAFFGVQNVYAANINEAKVSFTFDDGFASTYDYALPILSARNMPATVFVTTGFIGQSGYMSWAEVQELQNAHNWEIGAHTVTHPELPLLTDAQILQEITDSNTALTNHGINVTSFATPFGAYNNKVLVDALKVYNLHRGFWDRELNVWPYSQAVLHNQSLETATSLAQAKAWIDEAVATNTWLVFTLHEVKPTPDPDYEYTVTTDFLAQVADYVQSKSLPVVNPNSTLEKPSVNLISNNSFESGLADWTTNNSSQVTLNTGNNGVFPNPLSSVLFTGGANGGHLFGSKVAASLTGNYLLSVFVNANKITAGELGIYIDEYDEFGNWISGQWKGLISPNQVKFFTTSYVPTSSAVSTFAVQTYMVGGTAGTAYFDGYELYDLNNPNPVPTPTPTSTVEPTVTPTGSATPTATPTGTPTSTPTPTATPVALNLINNGGFESLTSGWADNWTKSGTTVTIDTNSQGNEATNSLKFIQNAAWTYTFGEKVLVNPADSYVWSQYVKTTTGTGEFGFYIDEYDAANNWISGQWKGQVAVNFDAVRQFAYKPTSANVVRAAVQYYMSPNTTLSVTIDSVSLASSTPVATPTPTASPTPTSTVEPTVTPTGSATPTATPTGTPTSTPTPTATPVAVNLINNSGFEALTSGWANNWTRNGSTVSVDTFTQGNEGTNSLHFVLATAATHTFGEKVAIVTTSNYQWSQFVKTTTGTGEFGFYVDEYDAANNWISGQWKGMSNAATNETRTISYTPTSSNVATAAVQYYMSPNTTFEVFIDSVSLIKQ